MKQCCEGGICSTAQLPVFKSCSCRVDAVLTHNASAVVVRQKKAGLSGIHLTYPSLAPAAAAAALAPAAAFGVMTAQRLQDSNRGCFSTRNKLQANIVQVSPELVPQHNLLSMHAAAGCQKRIAREPTEHCAAHTYKATLHLHLPGKLMKAKPEGAEQLPSICTSKSCSSLVSAAQGSTQARIRFALSQFGTRKQSIALTCMRNTCHKHAWL